jgi:hypothetical protein
MEGSAISFPQRPLRSRGEDPKPEAAQGYFTGLT